METNIKKSIQLTTSPLESIIEDGEGIDFRLDQEGWADLKEGDQIEFWEDFTGWQKEPTNESRKIVARIEKVYRVDKFSKLFEKIERDLDRLGDKTNLLNSLRCWWDEDKEIQEGVLAFYVKVV